MVLAVADFVGVNESSASVIIKEVSEAIARLRPQYIYMSRTVEDVRKVQMEFYNIARFPKVVGAIDCNYIRI